MNRFHKEEPNAACVSKCILAVFLIFQNKLPEFQRWGEDNQNEINQKRMELKQTIATDLLKVIWKIGEDERYVLILEKNESVVLIGSKSIDLTDRVINTYDLQKE